MSVKVKDVLDALQQMQKSLECSIWCVKFLQALIVSVGSPKTKDAILIYFVTNKTYLIRSLIPFFLTALSC